MEVVQTKQKLSANDGNVWFGKGAGFQLGLLAIDSLPRGKYQVQA